MADPMTLGELIAALENADLNLTVQDGIDTPHSYRGYYEQLAFEPATGVTVAQMLANAREALGATYEGYKGGEYTMREDTVCWIATWGACGVELTTERLRDMLAAGRGQDGQAAADPLTPERLTEIRQRADGATAGPWKAQDRTLYVVAPGHVHIADFEWLADTQEEWDEFQRNTVFVAAARQDVPALLAEVERLRAELADAREEERRQRETAEAASRGWRNEVAEVDHLRRTVAGWRDSYERLSRQVLRRHHAWQSARRGRKQARAELADLAAQNAKTEDNFRDFAEDALAVQRERDRLAEQAADRDDRIRSLHREVCGGACGLDDACECAYGEAVCDEDRAPYPCPTIRALDGTEAGT